MTWTGLLAAALAADPGRPLVTFYDDATGERVELSVATYANWVAKTANLLVDGLGAGPGDVVDVAAVPRHWQLAVWAGATWSAGSVLSVGEPAADAAVPAVSVVGPDVAAGTAASAAGGGSLGASGEVVGLSLRPLGGGFTGPLPPRVLDYALDVVGYGDRFDGPAPDGAATAMQAQGADLSGEELVGRAHGLARRWGLSASGRLLVAEPLAALEEVLACAVVPLAVAGSVVLVAHADADRLPGRAEQERVTATAGNAGLEP